jgi:hypothetical protein
MSDSVDRGQLHEGHLPGSVAPEPMSARLRASRVPPIVAAALVIAFGAGLIGFGAGYHLGQDSRPSPVVVAPSLIASATPTLSASPAPDLIAGGVSDRLQLAVDVVAARGWAVCELATQVTCQSLTPITLPYPAPEASFRLAGATVDALTRTQARPGHLVAAAFLGPGAATAMLVTYEPGAPYGALRGLSTIDPGGYGIDYFDLGDLASGRYALAVQLVGLPYPEATPFPEENLVAGFTVMAS